MKKFRRNQRIGALMKIFTERPNHVFSYNYFSDIFNSAKSTISEDIFIIKELVREMNYGLIETISGASGGVVFIPRLDKNAVSEMLDEICMALSDNSRIIAGEYIYMTDIFNSPYFASNLAKIIVSVFDGRDIDYVVTVETKGIPVALMTAKEMDVPLVVIRRNSKVTEGTTLSINYVSGSTRNIETMTLSRRAVCQDSKVLVVDDFMKGGGTAKGMHDMMKEFNAEVVGTAVVVATKFPERKLVDDYVALMTLEKVDLENNKIIIYPNLLNV